MNVSNQTKPRKKSLQFVILNIIQAKYPSRWFKSNWHNIRRTFKKKKGFLTWNHVHHKSLSLKMIAKGHSLCTSAFVSFQLASSTSFTACNCYLMQLLRKRNMWGRWETPRWKSSDSSEWYSCVKHQNGDKKGERRCESSSDNANHMSATHDLRMTFAPP